MPRLLNRRQFTTLLLAASPPAWLTAAPPAPAMAGRRLDFQIGEGFQASPADVKAVLLSAATELWQHCPDTRWETPGFHVFHASGSPINLYDHRDDGRIAIGVTSTGTYWSQYAYQFAHEFCHAIAGHSNDWRKTWIRGHKANHWLEESICETASLFVLKGMARTWQTTPPYPNWRDYATALAQYAADRVAAATATLPGTTTFQQWFRENEPAMRETSTLREKNNLVAIQLLPIFEAEPRGWESLSFFNLTPNRQADKSLATHFQDWRAAAPPAYHPFIHKLASAFGVSPR
jgi:hypothetical protein